MPLLGPRGKPLGAKSTPLGVLRPLGPIGKSLYNRNQSTTLAGGKVYNKISYFHSTNRARTSHCISISEDVGSILSPYKPTKTNKANALRLGTQLDLVDRASQSTALCLPGFPTPDWQQSPHPYQLEVWIPEC